MGENDPLLIAELHGAEPVSEAAIRRYLEAHEIGFLAFWDRDSADKFGYGQLIAPWATIFLFAMPAYWSPGDPPLVENVIPPFPYLKTPVDGSEVVTTSLEVEFKEPIRVGDHISSRWYLVKVTPKDTRIGKGSFMDMVVEFYRQDGTIVAIERTSAYRYTPHDT